MVTDNENGDGTLSRGVKDVSFLKFIADALLISDIYIYFPRNNKFKRFLYNIL
jgi:hypothetical protein